MQPRGSIKAPASPPTTRAGGADREGHPAGVKMKRGRQESRRIEGDLNKFRANSNQQGWLPPAALTGCGGRARGAAICISYIIYFNCCRQLTNITSTLHPRTTNTHASMRHYKSACQPPHHKCGWSRLGGAPGQSEDERGWQESRRMYALLKSK